MPCPNEEFSATVSLMSSSGGLITRGFAVTKLIGKSNYVILRYRDAHEPFSNMKFAQIMLHRNMEEFDAVISEKGRRLPYGCRSRYL